MENSSSTVAPFAGYGQPAFTQIPDLFLDHQMQKLTGNAVKVMLYIFRHTFGYGKKADAISYRQFVLGIVRADGQIIDQGAGISERGLAAALDELEEKGLVFKHLDFTTAGGRASTIYEINIDGQAHYQGGRPARTRPPADLANLEQKPYQRPENYTDAARSAGSTSFQWKNPDVTAKIADTPTAKIADTPTAKIADTPTAKIAETINNVTNKQLNKTHEEPALPGLDMCVDLLVRNGITQQMAVGLVALATSRGRIPGYVAQWVAYANSQSRIINTAGYLIRMIRANVEPPQAPQTAQEAALSPKVAGKPIDFAKYTGNGKYGFVGNSVPTLEE